MAGLSVRRSSSRTRGVQLRELSPQDASVLELVDRLMHKGVVLVGEATISVAGVDLIYLGLNVVLAAVETIQARERKAS
ncbi:MAG: gas vesicle protein [Chloroflexi bacterium]|nr:MAG: gas vesicle protein [Chloroflexota bacterium]